MDVVGSEIGHKMRSAIKAKLTELGCYVDDELPDYVMVMVANKRTRAQMEEDLQLFLGDNTELFVNWLHQVLKKLQEVTITPSASEPDKAKEKSKEKKSKDKKEKAKEKVKKTYTTKKAKKKEKQKLRKKDGKNSHKSKKKSKHEMIRPNIPPLLMNIEKESEPSITDVFAGQILKNHGITIDISKEKEQITVDKKPVIQEPKRPILPIIDPATILSQPETEPTNADQENRPSVTTAPREEQIKEINEIEAKIIGLKQKLAEQLDSMSDDEDFLNIRTEAEELMNDFAEDVFQEISSQAPPISTSPIQLKRTPSPSSLPPSPKNPEPIELPKEPPKELELPQIELKLPKRPIRERLGAKEVTQKVLEDSTEVSTTKLPDVSTSVKEKEDKRTDSPERFTPEREPDFWGKSKPPRRRLEDPPETSKKRSKSESEESDKSDTSTNKLGSKWRSGVRSRGVCASVVRVRPRPRAPASSLLLRAVADAHKSLLNIPPKIESEPQKVKRALVLPMRRVDAQNIVIQVPAERQADCGIRIHIDNDTKQDDIDKNDIVKEQYVPASLSKKITNTDYVPSRRAGRTASRKDDTLVVETINIHNTTVNKDKNTQFIVTMDGFNPNAFLAKKLKTEGLLDEDVEIKPSETNTAPKPVLKSTEATKSVLKIAETTKPVLTITETRKPVFNITETTKPVLNITETTKSLLKTTVIEEGNMLSPEVKTTEQEPVEKESVEKMDLEIEKPIVTPEEIPKEIPSQKKRLSDTSLTSDESDTQVILKSDDLDEVEKCKDVSLGEDKEIEEPPLAKKRKASPIVFDVKNKAERKRERTESASSDNHVIVTTATNSHKYDALPPLSQTERKAVWCRAFPLCRFGAACAFQHPRCKFAAACTRRACAYEHAAPRAAPPPAAPPPTPALASHVVPAANYKSISGASPSVCKYYPNCANPTCHYYHPKPCRYGKACANKLECNFYHNDVPSKWRFPPV